MIKLVGQALATPTGWLISPTRNFILFFIKDPKSEINFPNVITQLWYSNEDGIPTHLKNIRTMELENAVETWNELLNNGWKLIEHQATKDVA